MTPEAWQWADPAKVLERKQQQMEARHQHCGDCAHHKQLKLTETEHICDMGRHYGYQCTFYKRVEK